MLEVGPPLILSKHCNSALMMHLFSVYHGSHLDDKMQKYVIVGEHNVRYLNLLILYSNMVWLTTRMKYNYDDVKAYQKNIKFP